jgi:hypothetical protein
MFKTTTAQFDVAARNFIASHRNCPVEITIRGLDCQYSADTGTLRRLELTTESNGSLQLNIFLRRGSRGSSVKMINSIRCIQVTGRRLSIDSANGIHQDLECLSLHNAKGREKLLLLRHLDAIRQA